MITGWPREMKRNGWASGTFLLWDLNHHLQGMSITWWAHTWPGIMPRAKGGHLSCFLATQSWITLTCLGILYLINSCLLCRIQKPSFPAFLAARLPTCDLGPARHFNAGLWIGCYWQERADVGCNLFCTGKWYTCPDYRVSYGKASRSICPIEYSQHWIFSAFVVQTTLYQL